jgi:hypothetical protein
VGAPQDLRTGLRRQVEWHLERRFGTEALERAGAIGVAAESDELLQGMS